MPRYNERVLPDPPDTTDAQVRIARTTPAEGADTAPTHVPIMVREVLDCLEPAAGDFVVDCTLGGGGHARALFERITPDGHLLGLDIDDVERVRTMARLRAEGFGSNRFSSQHASFANLRDVLKAHGTVRANIVLIDLGVSAMQFDEPARGFSYRGVGPLDMRMNAGAGRTAAEVIASASESELASILRDNSDEPHADLIAHILKSTPSQTTHGTERHIRVGLQAAFPEAGKAAIKMSVRRTFQALRIAVNDEFAALDSLLSQLPDCLAPGGRAAVITFHSGEDRRVKKAFQAGHRAGVFSAIAERVIRSTKAETFSNRRASSAKLRWARRADS
ncbi:MAG: 16S rRNA (cytosine(1402)-N(4))-methyltransferase RsmH [Vicinamibacterales bacterium]